MSDLESLVRDCLTDDRRQLTPPLDPSQWVRGEARRQRRRRAAVGAVAASLVFAAAVTLVAPALTDAEAKYVAGQPPVSSELLPWEPVGSLTEDVAEAEAAVAAWKAEADDDPAGAVYAVASDENADGGVLLLQARTEQGTPSIAVLTRAPGNSWRLRQVTELPAGPVEAVQLPTDVVPAPRNAVGASQAPWLVLAPQWRSTRTTELGWQLIPAGPGFGDVPTWRPLERVTGYGWLAHLVSQAPGLPATTAVLQSGGPPGSPHQALVLDLGGAADLVALTPGDVTLRVLPGDATPYESLEHIESVAEKLDMQGPITVTVLDAGRGSFSLGHGGVGGPMTDTLFAQFETAGGYVLVADATTEGVTNCLTTRELTQDVTLFPLIGLGCGVPVNGSRSGEAQGNELWARSFLRSPGPSARVEDVTVTLVRRGGQTTTQDIHGNGATTGVLEEVTEPVQRYVFAPNERFAGGSPKPWVWPGWARGTT